MIDIKEKSQCMGCGACVNICPKNAIKFKKNEEGFEYPKVDKDKCINCGLCDKICPMKNKAKFKTKEKGYAVLNKNGEIRNKSTSGGAFSAIAENILSKNGVVFGATYNESFEVEHTMVEKIEDLNKFRGSKYVQSKIKFTFQEAEKYLKGGRYVLFSGTPCQIYGLKAYLQKDYKKLYCVDLICHGVPSPEFFNRYRNYQESKYKSKAKSIVFRNKTYGYNSSTMSIEFENGKKYNRGHESDIMIRAFMEGFCSRETCYECHFKTLERASDFTIGDFWKSERIHSELKDDKGVTLLITHSEKAESLLKELNNLTILETNLEKALVLNGLPKKSMMISSAEKNSNRVYFLKGVMEGDFEETVKKYLPLNFRRKTKAFIKPILYKTGLLRLAKKIVSKE